MIDKFGTSSQIFSVEGKKALITGGSKGLGRAMALCLLENGCDVFLTSRHVDSCKEVADYAETLGRKCYYYPCDVTKTEEVITMVDQAVKDIENIIAAEKLRVKRYKNIKKDIVDRKAIR